MDPQFVENLDEQIPQYDALACPLVPDENGHPAVIKHLIRYGFFELIASVIKWIEIDQGSTKNDSPADLLIGVAGHVGSPPNEHLVVPIIDSTQTGFDVV